MKKILIIFDKYISALPPLITIIDTLVDKYQLTVIVREHEEVIENEYSGKSVEFISMNNSKVTNNILFKAYNRLVRIHFFRKIIPKIIKQGNYDLVWIVSAEAAGMLKKTTIDTKYIFSIYELHANETKLLKKLKPIAQNAQNVIVPEFNRANILRVWLQLKETPLVIPNKPLFHPRTSNKEHDIAELKTIKDKKIILYQGHILRSRNLDALCEAVETLPNFVLVLMGRSHNNYLEELKSKYPKITHIDFVKPPMHLNITSHAYIGVVTYNFNTINNVFCAPNKIWEYSGFGIPMIGNKLPGLIYTIGKHKAGECVNMSNPEDIKTAIKKIEENYSEFSESSNKMYDTVDVEKLILSVVNDSF